MISHLVGTKQAPAHRRAMLETEALVAGALRRAAEAQDDTAAARAYGAREAAYAADAREAARQVAALACAAAARRRDSAVAEPAANGRCVDADDDDDDDGLAGAANATWKFDTSTSKSFAHRLYLRVSRAVAAGEELFVQCVVVLTMFVCSRLTGDDLMPRSEQAVSKVICLA